jgi:hypothetical protein
MASGREVHQQVDVVGFPVELAQFRAEAGAPVPHDRLYTLQVGQGEHIVPVFGHEDQVGMQDEHAVPACGISLHSVMNSNILSVCSSGTTTA